MDKIVYHGSPYSLEIIEANKSTHQKRCIYATADKALALLFMGKGHGDLDTRISTVDGQLELVERRRGVLASLYDKEGYLYELAGSTFEHYDYLFSKEVISFEKELVPLKKTLIPNIMSALREEEKKGHLTIYAYPDRPEDMPLDNSDLIDKYIAFEQSGLDGAINDLLDIYPEFKDEVAKRLVKEEIKKS